MLAAHSEIAIPPETSFFHRVIPGANKLIRKGVVEDVTEFFRYIGEHHGQLSPLYPFMDPGSFEDLQSPRVAQILDRVMTQYAESMGKVRWGEKTPIHLWHWEEIDDYFPTCKFIIMIRDGRDVACSLRGRSWAPNKVLVNGFRWTLEIDRCEALLSHLASARTLKVRYEDLVRNPEERLHEVSEFLGTKYEPTMISEFDKTAIRTNRDRPWARYKKWTKASEISKKSVGRWKRNLSPGWRRLLEGVMAERLEKHNYELEEDVRVCARWVIKGVAASMFAFEYARRRVMKKVNYISRP
jgi:hypothetical protein